MDMIHKRTGGWRAAQAWLLGGLTLLAAGCGGGGDAPAGGLDQPASYTEGRSKDSAP